MSMATAVLGRRGQIRLASETRPNEKIFMCQYGINAYSSNPGATCQDCFSDCADCSTGHMCGLPDVDFNVTNPFCTAVRSNMLTRGG